MEFSAICTLLTSSGEVSHAVALKEKIVFWNLGDLIKYNSNQMDIFNMQRLQEHNTAKPV